MKQILKSSLLQDAQFFVINKYILYLQYSEMNGVIDIFNVFFYYENSFVCTTTFSQKDIFQQKLMSL